MKAIQPAIQSAIQQISLAFVGMGAIGLLGGFALPVAAQTIQPNPNQALPGLGSSDQSSSSMPGAEGFDMYDLIHQLQLGPLPSMSEFNQQQQRTINSAASDFRTRQLELLRQQNQSPQMSPVAPQAPAQSPINALPQ